MQLHRGLVPGEPHAVGMLEASYRLDRPEDEWVEGIRQAFVPSAPGAELVQAFLYDASDASHLRLRAVCGGSETQRRWMASTGGYKPDAADFVRAMFNGRSTSRISSRVHDREEHQRILRQVLTNDWGLIDNWGLMAGDLHRRGVSLTAISTRWVPPLSAGLRALWDATAAHLSAAYCLREAMAAGMAPTESVLAPDGSLLHAEGEARSLDARESLRHAVRAIDRARVRHRRQSPEALVAWQAVVAGRWTLVDQTESDGKRVLLARVNELPVRTDRPLSEREAQVVGLAAQGWSNKQIAYRLGVGAPAVTNYLKRAAQKLGVSNRMELVRRAPRESGPTDE